MDCRLCRRRPPAQREPRVSPAVRKSFGHKESEAFAPLVKVISASAVVAVSAAMVTTAAIADARTAGTISWDLISFDSMICRETGIALNGIPGRKIGRRPGNAYGAAGEARRPMRML